MLDTAAPNSQDSNSQIATQRNLRRLVVLRDIGIAAQATLIAIAIQSLELPLPLFPLVAILVGLGIWNLFTWWRARQAKPVTDCEFLLQLAIDVIALTGVLYFTGGATNPFVGIYLLPLMIAATVLPKSYVWSLTAFTVACYSLLLEFYLPLNPADHMHHDSGFTQHVFGMWFGFVFSAVLIATFVTNMASTLRERDRVLAQAREQALRDERLVALGTLAAGAAHELGTPLGTMAIVTDELVQDYPAEKDAALHDNLQLIRSQIDRCKEALSVISASAGELRADSGSALPVDTYLKQVIAQWRNERPDIKFQQKIAGDTPAPQILADRALSQALTNILNNAADASPHWVELHAQWTPQQLVMEINDQGPGLSEGASHHLGKAPYSSKEHGLGLGLFLAHAVIGRLGGEVMLFNREAGNNDVQGGLCTRITLPLTGRAA